MLHRRKIFDRTGAGVRGRKRRPHVPVITVAARSRAIWAVYISAPLLARTLQAEFAPEPHRVIALAASLRPSRAALNRDVRSRVVAPPTPRHKLNYAALQDTAPRGLQAGYQRALDHLHAATAVPPRLPRHLDAGVADDSVFVVVGRRVDSARYYVVYASDPYCVTGGSVCRYGSASGERVTPATPPVTGRRVLIRPGLVGRYVPGTCAAGCSDSYVYWTEGPYRYSVGVKRGSLPEVLRMARSVPAEQQ